MINEKENNCFHFSLLKRKNYLHALYCSLPYPGDIYDCCALLKY